MAVAAAVCFGLASCGDNGDNQSEKGSDTTVNNSSEGNETNEGDNSSTVDQVTADMRDVPSVELVKEMSIGWNLGNTLDAVGGKGLESEVAWQPDYTTKEMVDLLKASGFNIFRVPTTWEAHIDENGIIDEAWMDRVQEIVDFGIDNEMFVILNLHHEEWHFPSYENAEAAEDMLVNVWTQIAERFKNYDEHLIFEGMNEPRKKGTAYEWNGGDAEGRKVVNQLNAAFVNTVRNSGGNNKLRHLMIPTYAASADRNAMSALEIPDDDKIIVSVHAYIPYDFALNVSGTALWSADKPSDTGAIDSLFNLLYQTFLYDGYPVIIGEFGSVCKLDPDTPTGDNLQSRIDCAEYFVSKAKEYGVPCVWWDNGSFVGSGENFGLMDRGGVPSWRYPEIVKTLTGVEIE